MPDLTPAHQLDLLTGINGVIGGSDFGLPIICGNRINPVDGSTGASILMIAPRW